MAMQSKARHIAERTGTGRRTTLILEPALLAEARSILGTETITETVELALREVVDRHHRRGLADEDYSGLTAEVIAALRAPRARSGGDEASV
jgi:Arc/MetJ family transcription regulator